MNTFLWVLQVVLALFFLMPAGMKLLSSKQKLIEKGMVKDGESDIPSRLIGTMELLGSIGLILPMWLNILPILTPIAAIGFCIIMIGAFAVHFGRKEYKQLALPVLIFILSAIVAWYRFQG